MQKEYEASLLSYEDRLRGMKMVSPPSEINSSDRTTVEKAAAEKTTAEKTTAEKTTPERAVAATKEGQARVGAGEKAAQTPRDSGANGKLLRKMCPEPPHGPHGQHSAAPAPSEDKNSSKATLDRKGSSIKDNPHSANGRDSTRLAKAARKHQMMEKLVDKGKTRATSLVTEFEEKQRPKAPTTSTGVDAPSQRTQLSMAEEILNSSLYAKFK
jgi:hypothetical protein